MKINTLNYKVYGKLIDYDIELSPTITVFLGDNEAGKSTIFNSISTLIYGFKPSNRERHPYVNWQRNEINFSSKISDSGELFTAERSLKSMPRLNIVKDNNSTTQVLRNEPLPFVNHVSEALFEAVFHLTAEDLNQFEKTSFEKLQEKLIFNYGTDYLNKASDVILQLEQDINALWRKDKRGNPKINQLQNEISQLKLQRHDAEKNYETVRTYLLKIESIDVTLEHSMSDKQALEKSIRQSRVNLPIRELIERIEVLRRSVYKMEAFSLLDSKLIDKIDQNQIKIAEAESKAEKLRQEREILKEDLFVYSDHDKKLFHSKVEIESLKSTLNDLIKLEHEEHSKLEELMKLRERISAQYKILFNSELDDAFKPILKEMPVLDLMTLFQKYIEGSEKNAEIEKRALENQSQMKKSYLLLGLAGITAFILGLIFEPLRLLTFIGIGIFGFSVAHIKSLGSTEKSETVDLIALKQKIDATCKSVQFPEYVFRDNSLRFFGKLEQLILLLHEEDTLHEKWVSCINNQNEIELNLSKVMQLNGFDASRGAVLSLQYILAQMERLSEIEAIEARKQIKIDLIDASIENCHNDRTAYEATDSALKRQVENFGEGDFEFGMKMMVQNTELTRKIKVYNDELSLLQYDVNAVLETSEAQILNQEAQISEIDSQEKRLLAERYRLTSEIDRYNEGVNLEAISSQILDSEAQLEELIEHRNELMVLLEIIKFSDERYRVENQPNIITRVSQFMNQMTHGKYQEVLVSEDNGHFELQFLIKGEIIPVSKAFSKGTIQQLFFAYRLAVLEALDPQNQLPFVLDEAFVNWDSKRFIETLKLLENVAKERQILIFTCHRNLANQISEYTTSKRIEVAV